MKIINFFKDQVKRDIFLCTIAGISLILSLTGILNDYLPFDIAWVAIILNGLPLIIFTLNRVIRYRDITAGVLVSIALIAAIIVGEYFAAGEVVWIMAIGTLLEDATVRKAQKGIEKLIKLTPKTARIKENGVETIISTSDVKVGDTLVVLAGETIAVDGIITLGNTSIDQSNMTGESIPVDKKEGDEVISGTINQFGTFEMKTTKNGEDSSLQRMIKLAKEADANKAPIIKLADKWATWLVVVALTIAGFTWAFVGIIPAVTILVVFCPCAFVLATPTAVIAGIGNLTKYGIIVRSGDALQRFSKIDEIVFDKTGTLTQGKPVVTEILSLDNKYSKDDILRLSALAEQRSEHPLGKAIVSAYTQNGYQLQEIKNFTMKAGMGIYATVEQNEIIIGKLDFMQSENIKVNNQVLTQIDNFSNKGATTILVSSNGMLIGLLALADTIRQTAKSTVASLISTGVNPTLLTGDNELTAQHIAKQVGIIQIKANMLPEQKMQAILDYKTENRHVLMIGDGVNDALALKTAYAGIAMGGIGSDIAVEAADAVLVSDNINHVPHLLKLSKKVMKRIGFNIAVGLVWNAIAVVLSIMGQLNPVTAALVHNIGSIFVVISSALLLSVKDDSDVKIDNSKNKPSCRC